MRRARTVARGPSASGLAMALALTIGLGPGCLSPASAESLVATGFRSPLQCVTSYQTFLRADLPLREYLCFSDGFRQRNGLSAFTYGEAREELMRQQPWLKLLARAEVVGERAVGAGEHWIDLRTLGRTVRVKLVREDFFEILAGEDLVDSASADFERLVRVSGKDPVSTLSVRLALERPQAELAAATEILVARHWKIDDLRELQDPASEALSP